MFLPSMFSYFLDRMSHGDWCVRGAAHGLLGIYT